MKTILPISLSIVMFTSISLRAQSTFLSVEGEVLRPLKLTVTDLQKFVQTEINAKDREGREHTYRGVLLVNVLDSAGVTLGKQLRGENLAKFVLVKAADGYEVVYALPELDPEFTNDVVLLAYQVDGKPLPAGEGPFRLVAPADKKPARWIREITTVKVQFARE